MTHNIIVFAPHINHASRICYTRKRIMHVSQNRYIIIIIK